MSLQNTKQESHRYGAALAVYTHHLHVAYDTTVILHGLDIEIPIGQCVAITGANGSGKSTFVKALMGSAPVTEGELQIFGKNARGKGLFGRSDVPWNRIGYVPQRPSAASAVSSTALEVVRSGLLGPKQWWYTAGSKQIAEDALRRVGLLHRAQTPVQELSGGQHQRVRIARALARDPELLILDEPLAGIDRHSQEKLAQLIEQAKEQGKTIVLILHELGPIEPHIERIINLASGHVNYDGPVATAPHTHTEEHHHYPHPDDLEIDIYGGGNDE
ncbi:ATP-binding cassette domain-containing protein [uncultured Actinomyces sp.]|uniref:metal ABC transporter ATP-binding protein n=1 Tax=uncultured Actinomyces sp. TaxID=249061 RepID=UPI0026237BAD|nr:ATP-binding cassette domain-containing protein [uncultured Actinomyces sp.]